jgi:hypothetical protein
MNAKGGQSKGVKGRKGYQGVKRTEVHHTYTYIHIKAS